jgi:hypothetical protein
LSCIVFYTNLAFDQFCIFNSRSDYLEQKRKEHAEKKRTGKKQANNAKEGKKEEQKV